MFYDNYTEMIPKMYHEEREYRGIDSLRWWIYNRLKIDVSGIPDMDDLWKFLSQSVNLPKEFIIEFSDYLNWRLVSQFQNLDDELIFNFWNKLDLDLVATYQNLTPGVTKLINNGMGMDTSNNWRMKDTYTKIKLLSEMGFKCYRGGFMGETFDPIKYYGFYEDPRYIDIETVFGVKNAIPCRENKKIYKCLARYEDIFSSYSSVEAVEVTNAFILSDNSLFNNSLLKRDYNFINDKFKLSDGVIYEG